jgi:hypothetical protein
MHHHDGLQVIGAAIQSSLAVPQHPWSAEYVVESVLSELTAPSTTTNSSSGSDGSDHAAVNATKPSQPVTSRGKASRAAAAAAEPAGIADTPSSSSSSSVRLLPEVAALLEDYTAAAAAAVEGPSTGKGDGVAAAGSTRRSRSHSSTSSRAIAESHVTTDVQVEQLQVMFSQLLYEEYQQVTWGDSGMQLSHALCDCANAAKAETWLISIRY